MKPLDPLRDGVASGLCTVLLILALGNAQAEATGSAKTSTATAGIEDRLGEDVRSELERINRRRKNIQLGGMLTLGTWATANVVVGVVGDVTADERDVRANFFQATWIWNSVNLIIVGITLPGVVREDPASVDYQESIKRARVAKLANLFNGVLDLAYVATGAWLWDRGLRTDEDALTGWGQAVVMQGSFLLVYDVTMFILGQTVSAQIDDLPVKLVPTRTGAGLALRF